MRRWGRIAALAVVASSSSMVRAQEPDLRATLDLKLDLDEGTLSGTEEIALVNSSTVPLTKIPLVLYPNRFRTLDPAINDVNFDRYHSPRFDPGSIQIEEVTGADGRPLRLDTPLYPSMPEGTYVGARLDPPVPPRGIARARVRFTVKIPDRFGPFGRRDATAILEGGAWPCVPARGRDGVFDPTAGPMLGRLDVKVAAQDADVAIGHERFSPVDRRETRATIDARSLLIAASSDRRLTVLASRREDEQTPEIWALGPTGQEERARRVVDLAKQAARVAREWLPPPASGAARPRILLVQAPLRDRLAHAAGDAVLYSDRLFEVLPLIDGFHEIEVVHATLLALVRRSELVQRLEPTDAGWVTEALAWTIVQEWWTHRSGIKGEDIRSVLDFFSFIPAVDALYRAPRFPESDVFYGRFYEPADAVKDELARFGSPRPRGRVIAEKLRDRIGTPKLLELVKGETGAVAPNAPSPFRERAAALAGEDLAPFFDLWLSGRPRENLALGEVEELPPDADGHRRMKVEVIRDQGDPRIGKVGEPVTVQLSSTGKPSRATWDGKGDRGEVVLFRAGTFYSLAIDPDERIDEAYRGDDIWPDYVKILVNRFSVSANLNQLDRWSASVGFTVLPLLRYDHAITLDGYYEPGGRGFRVGYAYGYGITIDERTYGQSIGASIDVEHLSTGLINTQSGITFPESKGDLVSVTGSWGFSTRYDSRHPTTGFSLGVSLEAADKILGTHFRFYQLAIGARQLITPARPHTFAFSVSAGVLWGTDPPTQRLFDAGAVRGVQLGDFLDRANFIAQVEYRWRFLEDLDVNVLWLAWARGMELCAFCDAGDVGYRFEYIFRKPRDWKVGAGGGVRFDLDVLGVNLAVFRFDVAWRVDEPGKGKQPQYYIGVNQSF